MDAFSNLAEVHLPADYPAGRPSARWRDPGAVPAAAPGAEALRAFLAAQAPGEPVLCELLAFPSPATHWVSVQLKAGETVCATPFGSKTVQSTHFTVVKVRTQ